MLSIPCDVRLASSLTPPSFASSLFYQLWLKHGTCSTVPEAIWSGANGADGIDSRYCSADSANLLGVGAYFAEVGVLGVGCGVLTSHLQSTL